MSHQARTPQIREIFLTGNFGLENRPIDCRGCSGVGQCYEVLHTVYVFHYCESLYTRLTCLPVKTIDVFHIPSALSVVLLYFTCIF